MKKNTSVIIAMLMMVSMFLAFATVPVSAAQASGETLTLQAGHVLTVDSAYHRALVELANRLFERTNGRVKIEIFPNSTLGNERDMIESVQLGLLDITLPNHAPMVNFTDVFQVFDLPFLFNTREEAYAVCDSEFGQSLLDSLESINIKGISLWENGLRHMANSKKEVKTPADLAGMKIRTMENNIHMASFRVWGADPTAMAWGEVYTALQQKTIDGLENMYGSIYLNKMNEIAKYISETGHFYCAAPLIISVTSWNKMTPADQQVFIDTANEVKLLEREWNYQDDLAMKENMIEEGAVFVNGEDIDKALWRDASQSVYDTFISENGSETLNTVQSLIDAVRNAK